MTYIDEQILDNPTTLFARDPGQMLRATADAGAQIRRGLTSLDREAISRAAADGRPRGMLVAGMGGSGISANVLSAVAGPGCPIPLQSMRGYNLPGWVGPLDVVVAVSCSGQTEETLSAAEEAAYRGAHLIGIGAAGSALADLVEQANGIFLNVDVGALMPRAALWAMATPLLLLADALGVASVSDAELARAADVLDEVAQRCGPAASLVTNPAKMLGLGLAESVPAIWGTSALAGVAAYRAACQLNENAKLPCTHGAFPEVNHNQVVAFDGPMGQLGSVERDIFHDPVEEETRQHRLRIVLLRDSLEHPQDARRALITSDLATSRGIPVDVVAAQEGHAVVRLASLIGVIDWASVYTALALGIDPSPIGPINELKDRIS